MRPDEGETATSAAAFLPAEGEDLDIADLPLETLATICFTSGTSGRPKGVMLSHGNILANVAQCRETGMARPDDLFLSILPLSHMFERTGGYYLPLAIGARVAFCRGIAQVAEDLESQAPTVVFAVPRIFERFHARIARTLASSPAKRILFAACVARGYRVATRGASTLDHLLVPLLRKLVAAPVLARLGGRLRLAVVGGAALDPELARTFIGLGLPMLQGYGMTEASPVISVNRDHDNVPESVGPPLAGIAVRLGDANELHVQGANVMLGYWRDAEATAAAFTRDGWLRTGDQAEINEGKLYIRGRAKDVLVMSNGEKVAPQDAEFAILHDPVFEQVMLVGEGRPCLVLLAVTREEDEKNLVKRANERLVKFPRWMRIRRVVAMREPWSVDNGLLTPTLKLKRPLLLKKLKDEVDRAYADLPA
jgi:long-chain acyl-CoA synthetase